MPSKTASAAPWRPFENESDSRAVGGLTIENRVDRVELYGSITITRDQRGLLAARALKEVVDAVVDTLSREALPARVEDARPVSRPNPFA